MFNTIHVLIVESQRGFPCVCFFQPKPHFQSRGQTSSTSSSTKPATEPRDQPLSYAEFIVQSKSNAAAPPQREAPPKRIRSEDAVVTDLKQREPASTVQGCVERAEVGHSEVAQEAGKDQKEGSCQRSDPNASLGAKPVGSGSSIIVSPRQVCIKMYPDLENSSYTAVSVDIKITDSRSKWHWSSYNAVFCWEILVSKDPCRSSTFPMAPAHLADISAPVGQCMLPLCWF